MARRVQGPSPMRRGDDTMALWFEESDKRVWHLMTRREGLMNYHAACGWHLAPYTGRIWPQKAHEAGPPEPEQCRTCVGKE